MLRGVQYPLAPLLALLNNIVEMAVDTDKIARDRKRIWKAVIQLCRQGIKPLLSLA